MSGEPRRVFLQRQVPHVLLVPAHAGLQGRGRGYQIGYASSSDLRTWTRDDARAGIAVSPEGWDSETISYPNVFELDGSTYMYYQGNQVGKFGFGLARLEAAS